MNIEQRLDRLVASGVRSLEQIPQEDLLHLRSALIASGLLDLDFTAPRVMSSADILHALHGQYDYCETADIGLRIAMEINRRANQLLLEKLEDAIWEFEHRRPAA